MYWAENFALNWSFHLFMFFFVNPTPLLEFTRSGKRLSLEEPLGIWVELVVFTDRVGFDLNSELGASEEDALSTMPPDLGLFIDAHQT